MGTFRSQNQNNQRWQDQPELDCDVWPSPDGPCSALQRLRPLRGGCRRPKLATSLKEFLRRKDISDTETMDLEECRKENSTTTSQSLSCSSLLVVFQKPVLRSRPHLWSRNA